MSKIIIITICLLLSSCGFPPSRKTEYEIPEADKDKAAKFIADVCEKSNPKSDEEPEDMIKQAEATALRIFGKPVKYVDYRDGKGYVLDN